MYESNIIAQPEWSSASYFRLVQHRKINQYNSLQRSKDEGWYEFSSLAKDCLIKFNILFLTKNKNKKKWNFFNLCLALK